MNKKKLGIIGGMGSRAGAYLLQKIIDYSPAETDQEFPEIIFHNNAGVPDRTKAILYRGASPVEELLKSISLFNENEVGVIAMACITAYYYYPQLSACTNANLLNPLQLTAEHIRNEFPRVKRVGLLATTGTLHTKIFHHELAARGLEVVTLSAEDQELLFMRAVYMRNGFKSAHIVQQARHLMQQAVEKLSELQADVIIGGCTEVSVASIQSFDCPYIDTLDLLARKTVEYCYNAELIKT